MIRSSTCISHSSTREAHTRITSHDGHRCRRGRWIIAWHRHQGEFAMVTMVTTRRHGTLHTSRRSRPLLHHSIDKCCHHGTENVGVPRTITAKSKTMNTRMSENQRKRERRKRNEVVDNEDVVQDDVDDDVRSGIRNRDDLYQFIRSAVHIPSLLGDGSGGLLTLSVSTIYAGSSIPKDVSHSHFTALTLRMHSSMLYVK